MPFFAQSPRSAALRAFSRFLLTLSVCLVVCSALLSACEREVAATPAAPQEQVVKPGAPALHKQIPLRLVGVAEPNVQAIPMLRSQVAPSAPKESGR